jgi:hypothetical protein
MKSANKRVRKILAKPVSWVDNAQQDFKTLKQTKNALQTGIRNV